MAAFGRRPRCKRHHLHGPASETLHKLGNPIETEPCPIHRRNPTWQRSRVSSAPGRKPALHNTAGRAQIGGSLCALKDGRCYPTGRRVRVCKAQLVPDDDKGSLVVLALPIWKCRAVNLKREALFRLVNDALWDTADENKAVVARKTASGRARCCRDLTNSPRRERARRGRRARRPARPWRAASPPGAPRRRPGATAGPAGKPQSPQPGRPRRRG